MNPEAVEGHLTLVLIQWIIIIAAAWAFGRLGKKFGHALPVGEIAAGIILGPSVLGLICNWLSVHLNSPSIAEFPTELFPASTQTSMQLLGKLGLIFLLFQVGMEFDYSLVVFFALLQKIIGPWMLKIWRDKVPDPHEKGMPNSFLALLLIALFASCLATHYLGIFVIFGAFLFGTCLHQEPALVKAWRDRFSGVVLVAFVPIFFTNTGLNTKIGSLQTPMAWLACGIVLVAAVVGKLGGCYLGARLTGQPPRVAASIAALMNTRALMGLVAINVGLDLKLLTPELFTMLVIMALLTTAMCGPLLRWWLPKDLRKLVPD